MRLEGRLPGAWGANILGAPSIPPLPPWTAPTPSQRI